MAAVESMTESPEPALAPPAAPASRLLWLAVLVLTGGLALLCVAMVLIAWRAGAPVPAG